MPGDEGEESKALNAISKSRKVVEVAKKRGKVTSKSEILLGQASQSLARKEYKLCVVLAKDALHCIGEEAPHLKDKPKPEPKKEDGVAAPFSTFAKTHDGEEVSVQIGDGNKRKDYNAFLGQFKKKPKKEENNDDAPSDYAKSFEKVLGKPLGGSKEEEKKEETPKDKGSSLKGDGISVPKIDLSSYKSLEGEGQKIQTGSFQEKLKTMGKKREPTLIEKIKDIPNAKGVLQTSESCSVLEELRNSGSGYSFPIPKDMTKLPFTHGIEMELQVIKKNGDWIEGSILESIFKAIVQNAETLLNETKNKGKLPDIIMGKLKRIWTEEINETNHIRGLVLCIEYSLGDRDIKIEALGRDPHGVGVTWLLEGVTPPCEFLEELEWWTHYMFWLSYMSVQMVQESFAKGELEIPSDSTFREDDANLVLVSSGLNPTQKFVTGISFGDHHHIGIPDEGLRKDVYNLFRAYLPHLIALSVNSPIEDGRDPNPKFTKNRIVAAPLSYRLALNEGQMCSGEANTFIPHLEPEHDVKYFTEVLNKSDEESARLVEMFPFTRYGTIELRVFDAQASIQDRIGMAVLLQSMALKAKNLRDQGKKLPPVSSLSLVENRKRAIKKGGLLGLKKDGALEEGNWFNDIYQQKLAVNPEEKVSRLSHSIQNMFHFLKDEIREISPKGTYLDSFLISVYSGDKMAVDPPLSQAQYLLYIYDSLCKRNLNNVKGENISLLEHMGGVGRRIALSKVFNPLVEAFGAPNTPGFLRGEKVHAGIHLPPTQFKGQDCLVSMKIKNTTSEALSGLRYQLKVDSSLGETVYEKQDSLGTLEPGQEGFVTIPIKPQEGATYFQISGDISSNEGTIGVFGHNIVLDEVFCSVGFAGEAGPAITGPMRVPFLFRFKHNGGKKQKFDILVQLFKEGSSEPLQEFEMNKEVIPDRELVIGPNKEQTKEELRKFLKLIDVEETEFDHVSLDKLGTGGNFHFKAQVKLNGKILKEARSDDFKLGG